jgi:hypothetical protein
LYDTPDVTPEEAIRLEGHLVFERMDALRLELGIAHDVTRPERRRVREIGGRRLEGVAVKQLRDELVRETRRDAGGAR